MVLKYAIIGAIVALVPMASFVLIPMEVYMVYKIATRHQAFDLVHFAVFAAALVAVSTILKGMATYLHVIVGIGQLANAGIAFFFILALGAVAEKHYEGQSAKS